MYPNNSSRPAAAVRLVIPTEAQREELAARLERVVRERIGRIRPIVRGVGVRQTDRVVDAKRGREYAVSNLLAVVTDLVLDPRIDADDVDALFADLSLECRVARGEATGAPEAWDAVQEETAAQGLADCAVNNALRTGETGATLTAIDETRKHRAKLTRVELALAARLRASRTVARQVVRAD